MASKEINNTENEILLIRGESCDGKDCIQMYDVDEDKWYPEIELTFQCRDMVPLENKIYSFVAEFRRDKQNLHDHYIILYDLTTKDVEVKSIKTAYLWGDTAGVFNGYIYFCNNREMTISCYDPKENSSEKLGKLKGNFDCPGFLNRIFLDGQLYVIGQYFENERHSLYEMFNPETKQSTNIADYPVELQEKENISGTAFQDKLFTILDNSLEYLYVYSPSVNKWESIRCLSPPSVIGGKLITCQEKLICVDSRMFLHVYDPDKNKWKSRIDYNGAMKNVLTVLSLNKPN